MTAAGIITEYNPLHMGHVHLMAEARRLLGPETGILCVMSGNYVQRGDFAIADKAARAAAASGNENYKNTVFLGFDGIQSACNSILAGEETMSVCQEGYSMGYNSVDAVVRALQGEQLDEFIDAGASIVDPSNAQARLEQLQGYLA